MLIGETRKGESDLAVTFTWIVGACLLLFCAGAIALQGLVGLGAATIGAAVLLARFEKR